MAWYDSVIDTVSGAASSLFGGSSKPSSGGSPYTSYSQLSGNPSAGSINPMAQSSSGGILDMLSGLGQSALGGITGAFTDSKGNIDYSRIAAAGGALGDAFGLFDTPQQKVGYQGKIPTYTASRMQVPNTYDPARRPGSGGQRYFTDVSFSGGDLSGQAAGLEALNRANLAAQNRMGQQLAPIRAAEDAAKAAAAQQIAATPAAATPAAATPAATPAAQAAQLASALGNRGGTMPAGGSGILQGSGVATSNNPAAAQSFNQLSPAAQAALLGGAMKGFAQGGIAQFAEGNSVKETYGPDAVRRMLSDGRVGIFVNEGRTLLKVLPAEDANVVDKLKDQVSPIVDALSKINPFEEGGMAELKRPQYLDGATDGMADEIDASIEGEQPAALSDGEFVIPADVVSHLGNGNSDAGAKVLEKMMSRVRKERTGSTKQGKEIDPEEFLPA